MFSLELNNLRLDVLRAYTAVFFYSGKPSLEPVWCQIPGKRILGCIRAKFGHFNSNNTALASH
jgi:hypothetical protein